MKFTDDYDAKYKIWARNPQVCRLPECTGIPRFGSRRFSSWEEFNAWKQDLLLQIARNGGVKWKK